MLNFHAVAAIAMLAAAATPAAAETYYFRTKPAVTPPKVADLSPDPITFPKTEGATVGSSQVSAVRQLKGHDGVPVSVSGGEWRACSSDGCAGMGDSGWTAAPGAAADGTYVQLRTTAPAAGTTATVVLAFGSGSASWSVTGAAGSAAFEAMGITDAGLNAALTQALGGQANWAKCLDMGVVNNCGGASAILVLHRSGGYQFGYVAKVNLFGGAYRSFTSVPGFYFTNAPNRVGYVMSEGAVATDTGTITAGGGQNASYADTYAIYDSHLPSPRMYARNGTWQAGFALDGQTAYHTPSTTVTIWKR